MHRAAITPRAVQKTTPVVTSKSNDKVDGDKITEPVTTLDPKPQQKHRHQQPEKLIIRATVSPDRPISPKLVKTPTTSVITVPDAVSTITSAAPSKLRGAYINVQGKEGKRTAPKSSSGTRNFISNSNFNKKTDNYSLGRMTNQLNNGNIRFSELPNGKRRINKIGEIRAQYLESKNLRFASDSKLKNKLSNFDAKLSKPSLQVNFVKTKVFHHSLSASGNTPKLSRRLSDTSEIKTKLIETAADNSDKENSVKIANRTIAATQIVEGQNSSNDFSHTIDRKLKRSESYRMANNSITFIKKFSTNSSTALNESPKIFRTPSEEIREELLKETINYPETVASPEVEFPDENNDALSSDEMSPQSILASALNLKIPQSPRPRATDLEVAKVLKYSGTETEIW